MRSRRHRVLALSALAAVAVLLTATSAAADTEPGTAPTVVGAVGNHCC
ncbi:MULTISPECIES: hypothetical protein [Nonomuraea]|uniref:Uncharacterized protein n=1 Tax=Nonomuraea mangrovi TaxID=2316207 RepID=A0ABW4T2A3_9ACTN